MMKTAVEDWLPLIEKVASWVARDFPGVEKDEVVSELVIVVLSEDGFKKRSPEDQGVASILVRKGKRAAWKQRAKGLVDSPQYTYRPSDVRKILETVFDVDRWPDSFVPDDARSELGCDPIEVSADVAWALELLAEDQRRILLSRYHAGGSGGDVLAHNTGAVHRAIAKLCDILNSYRRGKIYRDSRQSATQGV